MRTGSDEPDGGGGRKGGAANDAKGRQLLGQDQLAQRGPAQAIDSITMFDFYFAVGAEDFAATPAALQRPCIGCPAKCRLPRFADCCARLGPGAVWRHSSGPGRQQGRCAGMRAAAVARGSLFMKALVRAVEAGPACRRHAGFCL